MNVQTEIDRIISAVSDAHEKVVAKGGTSSAPYTVEKLANAIGTITTPVLQAKTVSPKTTSQSVTPDSGYNGLSKVTVNAMSTATQATPSISVSEAGLITASATQSAGYVSSGTKSSTKQLTTQAAKTITPTTSSQTAVSKGVYTTDVVTVAAIPSKYVDTSSATAVDREIANGKTAYVNGSLVTGTGLIYKKTTLTGWYGSGAVSGTTASCKYVRLLKNSGFTIIGGWLNITAGDTKYQLRFGGAGTSSTFKGMSNNQSTNSPGIGLYNGYMIAYIPSTKCNSLGIATPDSIEVVVYYRQF